MTEVIKITEKDGQQVVSLKELHKFLEIETRFDIWAKRMFEYGFTENSDYQCLNKNVQMPNGGSKEVLDDYAIKLDMAKEISMLQRTEKGKLARQYFIECEKKLKQLVLPRNYKEALQHLIAQVEINEKLLLENEQMKPKADFYDTIIEVGKNVDMSEVAKLLNKGFGRNKLFETLRNKKVLMRNNLPYQKYVDLGYFEVVEISKPKANGDLMVFTKTLVTQKGLDYINRVTN